jgi:phosphatidate phosphatase
MSADIRCRDVVARGVLELCALVTFIMPMAYIYVFAGTFPPYHRGFFCDDQNLKHPYLPQTVPIVTCVLVWAFISVTLIILVETLRTWAEKGCKPDTPIAGSKTPWIAFELYRHFGYFTLGALTCLLFTEMAKYTIGRLRPHFLTICQPDLTEALCKDQFLYPKFVTEREEVICKGLKENGGNYTKKQLNEARLSFLSGHSSFSFYCAMFVIVYLQARLTNFPANCTSTPVRIMYRTLKVLRPFIQFSLIILAFWISLTRISDYFHHPMDVATGALVGIVFAVITLIVIADLFNKRSAFWKEVGAQRSKSIERGTEDHNTSSSILMKSDIRGGKSGNSCRREDDNSKFPYIDQ